MNSPPTYFGQDLFERIEKKLDTTEEHNKSAYFVTVSKTGQDPVEIKSIKSVVSFITFKWFGASVLGGFTHFFFKVPRYLLA